MNLHSVNLTYALRERTGHGVAGLEEVHADNMGTAGRTAGRASCEGEGLEVLRGGHAHRASTSSPNLAVQETTSREQNDFTSANQARGEGTTGRFGFTLAAAGA